MFIPEDLKYTKDHEWVKIEGPEAFIGITDFAQGELGDIVYVDVQTEGETLDSEEVFGTIEAVKTASELYMPISGEVLEVNVKVVEEPEMVNKDPYGKGWIIKVLVKDATQANKLLTAEQYRALIG